MAASLDGAKDEAEANARGSSALREVSWNGASERQREVAGAASPRPPHMLTVPPKSSEIPSNLMVDFGGAGSHLDRLANRRVGSLC